MSEIMKGDRLINSRGVSGKFIESEFFNGEWSVWIDVGEWPFSRYLCSPRNWGLRIDESGKAFKVPEDERWYPQKERTA